MGWLADIGNWIKSIGTMILDGIIAVADWLAAKIAALRGAMIQALMTASAHPWGAILTIAGMVIVQIALQGIYDQLKKLAAVQKVIATLAAIGETIRNVMAWCHIDLILTFMTIRALLDAGYYEQLAKVYVSLGNLSEELALGFNFITSFLEVGRSMIHTTYAIFGGSASQAEADFSSALVIFLRGLTDKLAGYASDPESIFTDIQAAIAAVRTDASAERFAAAEAAIDKAADWINTSGAAVIALVDEIEVKLAGMPAEFQEEVRKWFDPMKKSLDDFVSLQWDPFWTKYNEVQGLIEAHFLRHDIDIQAIQDTLNTPVDMLRAVLMLPEEIRAEALADLDELVATAPATEILPVIESLTTAFAPLIAEGIALLDNPPLPVVPEEVVRVFFVKLPPGPTAIEEPALEETGADPYLPGGQKADGRSWYVG